MKVFLLFCFAILLVQTGSVIAQEEPPKIGKRGEPIFYIDKNTESGRGAFEMNNHFHNYCVAKYNDSSKIYRCKNQCIEKGYPVFNATGSAEKAILESGCFEIQE